MSYEEIVRQNKALKIHLLKLQKSIEHCHHCSHLIDHQFNEEVNCNFESPGRAYFRNLPIYHCDRCMERVERFGLVRYRVDCRCDQISDDLLTIHKFIPDHFEDLPNKLTWMSLLCWKEQHMNYPKYIRFMILNMIFTDVCDGISGDSKIKIGLTQEQLDSELDEYLSQDPRR